MPGNVLVLSPGPVPTTSIYLDARLPPVGTRIIDTRSATPEGPPVPGSEVVLVRHAPRPWLRWVSDHRAAFSRIVLLMDDDMPRAALSAELPPAYALRTALRHRAVSRWLAGCCDELWLSTPELMSRYPGSRSRLVEPVYVPAMAGTTIEGDPGPVWFYHGTRAHLDEIRWLLPVVEAVQGRCPRAIFEVFGNAGVSGIFRGVPRVRVRPWLDWPGYLAYSGTRRYSVGLAPCLDTPFNRARSQVKFFDITRLGAVGVYADLAPYTGMVRQGATGFLCPPREEEWVETIVTLLDDPERAAGMAALAMRACEAHRESRAQWPSADDAGQG